MQRPDLQQILQPGAAAEEKSWRGPTFSAVVDGLVAAADPRRAWPDHLVDASALDGLFQTTTSDFDDIVRTMTPLIRPAATEDMP